MVNWDLFNTMADDLQAIDSDDFDFFRFVGDHCDHFYQRANTLTWFYLLWRVIPDRYLYETYKILLSCIEGQGWYNGFFKPDLIAKIARLNKYDTIENPALRALLDAEGYLTVYHGHCKKTLRNSNSWTLDKEVAVYFAHRNALFNRSSNCYVITGRTRLENIIAYIDEGEADITVLNRYVTHKTKEVFMFDKDFKKAKRMVDYEEKREKMLEAFRTN